MKIKKLISLCLLFSFFSVYTRVFKSQIPENLLKRKIINKDAYQLLNAWYDNFGMSWQKRLFKKFTDEKPIIIIIPSYNNKDWYELNLFSVFAQHYDNYKVIYINDCSTDGTGKLVANFVKKIKEEKRVKIINNVQRHGALYNLYHAIHSCPDNAIIVTLDGDDWLHDEQVLSHINKVYKNQKVLLTYGQMQEFRYYHYTNASYCKSLPQNVIKNNTYREYKWVTSHLRTFYAGLFKKIKKEDLQNKDGEFWPMAWDQAFMLPMLEMAAGRIKFISDPLYVYNMATPTNDNKVNADLQNQCTTQIRRLKKYVPLDEVEVMHFTKKESESTR